MLTTLFAAAADPATFEWSPKCAIVMIACNVFAYAIARATIRTVSYTHLTLPTKA